MENCLAIIKFRSLIDWRHQDKIENFIKNNFNFKDLDNIDVIDIKDEFNFLIYASYNKIITFTNFLSQIQVLNKLIIISLDNIKDFDEILCEYTNKNIVNRFLSDNITIDFILDKLSKSGMNSLSEFEMDYLNSFK